MGICEKSKNERNSNPQKDEKVGYINQVLIKGRPPPTQIGIEQKINE